MFFQMDEENYVPQIADITWNVIICELFERASATLGYFWTTTEGS